MDTAVKTKKVSSSKTDSYQGFLRSSFNVNLWDENQLGMEPASEAIKIAGATFYLNAYKFGTEKTPLLGVLLSCEPDLDNIYYDGDICIINASDDRFSTFLVSWLELISKDNEFVNQDGDFVIEAQFSVKPRTNTEIPLDLEFLDASLVNSDCTLLVEGHRFAVSRGLLATYSNYFTMLFYGPFSEKNKKEVELGGVIAAEFAMLLKAMYQLVSYKLFGKTVECLLRLADYLQVRLITKQCSNYLKSSGAGKMGVAEKLLLAQDYNLPDVTDFCVGQCKTMDDLTAIIESNQYPLVAGETKLRVYENPKFSAKHETNTKLPLDIEFLDASWIIENHQSEVELEGVVAAEFAIFLKAIYQPVSNKNVLFDGSTYECLLRLADYFQVRLISKRCSNYLKSPGGAKVDMAEKLLVAQNYNLSDVTDFCVGQCKTMDDLFAITKSKQFSLLDSETQLRVYANATRVDSIT
uniref:BTB domain-containing protein n=1 Tax=Ditylenchus dipsaci TaxID=166011 RepID=A0A915DVZ6_9BILA